MPYKDKEQYNKYLKEYMLKRYYERRAWAYEKLGNKCQRCSTCENLELDHIDRNTKVLAIGKMWSMSKVRFEAEVEKCQLLCRDCHQDKSREAGDWLPKPL